MPVKTFLFLYFVFSLLIFFQIGLYKFFQKKFFQKMIFVTAGISFIVLSAVFVYKLARKLQGHFVVEISQQAIFPKATRLGDAPEPWWLHTMVAHAGGALFDDAGEMKIYTNAREAVELNYAKGHRVFEIDFGLTSDGRLAAVHDWVYGVTITESPMPEEGPTLAEWKSKKIHGKWTPMDIDDVVALMSSHPDMFLVTDTKVARDIDIILAEFREIRRAAEKVDIEILNRVVPQIYNPEMLQPVQSVWDWPSIIYTLYQSSQTPEEVIDFVKEHDEIHGITMWPVIATDEFIAELKKLDRVVYCHTINNFGEAFVLCSRGVHGLYTDYLYGNIP
jgi:glycerophosphoryl diester phosphodiesterase